MKYFYIKFILLFFIIALSNQNSFANLSTYNSMIPGGIAVIKLPRLQNNVQPVVIYKNNRVLTIQDSNNKSSWFAIIGIPLSVTPGIQHATLYTENGTENITFKVKQKTYGIEKINIKGKNFLKKSSSFVKKSDIKISKEFKEINNIYKHWLNTTNLNNIHLQLPVKGRKSSPFGLKRIFNGIPRNPHSGLDLAAPEGTPIKAPKEGVVIKTSKYILTGNAIFIEHGQGFITSYFHLKKIYAKVGKKVKQGEIIGLVGKTGRATGPHLHWSVSLNGVRVNPELFLRKPNENNKIINFNNKHNINNIMSSNK